MITDVSIRVAGANARNVASLSTRVDEMAPTYRLQSRETPLP